MQSFNAYINQLMHLVIRTSKEDSAFIYFQLESRDGLAFYSTLESSLNESYRDISLYTPLSLQKEMKQFVEYLSSELSLEILTDEIVTDSSDLIQGVKGLVHER